MSNIKIIKTNKAPLPIGPYSQAIIWGNLVFCSGQIGIDPKTGELKKGVEEQTKQVMENLKQVLEAARTDFARVLKTTIYLVDIEDFPKVNQIYEKYFSQIKPTRSTVAVKSLPKGALIEIELIACL